MSEPDLQKLRVAVAESDGWKRTGKSTFNGFPIFERDGEKAAFRVAVIDGMDWLPDYPTDRNAIIGAIVRRFVTVEHKTDFYCALHKLIREHIGGHWIGGAEDMFALATATAEQLCRAYCAAAGIPATEATE